MRALALLSSLALWGAGPAAAQEPPAAPARTEAADREDPTSAEAIRQVLERAPRRTRREGSWGSRVVSVVSFDAAPDRPHQLVLAAGFPDRTRLELSSADGRMERYQLGASLFGRDAVHVGGVPPGEGYLLEGAPALETELDMALRRAVFLWPDGRDFVGAGRSRTAKVRSLGVLLARVDEATGLPEEITALGPDGRAAARLTNIRWTRVDDRPWPESLEFWAGGERIWSERVAACEDGWVFGDPWFLPPDLMGRAVGQPVDAPLRMRTFEGGLFGTEPLPAPVGVDAARGALLQRWQELDARFRAVGAALAPEASLELDGEGRAVAIEFRFAGELAQAPEGWRARSGTARWAHRLEGDGAEERTAALAHLDGLVELGHAQGPRRLTLELRRGDRGAPEVVGRQVDTAAVQGPEPEEGPDARSPGGRR